MSERGKTARRARWIAAVRVALVLAALAPTAPAVAAGAPEQLAPASPGLVASLATDGQPRELADWERLRRHRTEG
jgi:hypothetical protein